MNLAYNLRSRYGYGPQVGYGMQPMYVQPVYGPQMGYMQPPPGSYGYVVPQPEFGFGHHQHGFGHHHHHHGHHW